MIGPVAKSVAASLRKNPKDWIVDSYTMNHQGSKFCLWIGNGLWSLGPYDSWHTNRCKKFNIVEKHLIYFSLFIGRWAHPLAILLYPLQLMIGFPGGLFIREPLRIRQDKKLEQESRDLKIAMHFDGQQFYAAINELLDHVPKAVALTSPNPVIRYHAIEKWKKNGSQQE